MNPAVFTGQIVGARRRQEDAFLTARVKRLFTEGRLLIVCDGMGGHAGGDIASSLVASVFRDTFLKSRDAPRRALAQALGSANEAVAAKVALEPDVEDMGTTLVAAFVQKADLHWISIGDSHLYHYRKGALAKLNADHSMAPILDSLAEKGEISKEDAFADPRRNALRSAVSGEALDLVDAQSKLQFLEKGDILLLASDGLDTLAISELVDLLKPSAAFDLDPLGEKLLAAVETRNKPQQDNATIVLYRA